MAIRHLRKTFVKRKESRSTSGPQKSRGYEGRGGAGLAKGIGDRLTAYPSRRVSTSPTLPTQQHPGTAGAVGEKERQLARGTHAALETARDQPPTVPPSKPAIADQL